MEMPDTMSIIHQGESAIMTPIDEFVHDAEVKLGRANGNVYIRRPGEEGLHDGQIMVRLKKKRFIVIDYSIVPSPADIALAAASPHMMVSNGAGKQKCGSQDCSKVGVPVMLFDSEPDEPLSLYLRSGLCFTCQRILNEKRRTQRKRKGDTNGHPHYHHIPIHHHEMDTTSGMQMHLLPGTGGPSHHRNMNIPDPYPFEKRFRLNGEILDLNPDAIIINGPLDDTKHHGPGYEYPEIGHDLQKITQEVSHDTMQLTNTVETFNEMLPHVHSEDNTQILAMYEKTFVTISKGIFLLNQWKLSWDAAVATASGEHNHHNIDSAVANADVVASAAAVAAAQTSVSEDSNQIRLKHENEEEGNDDDCVAV